MEEGGIVWSRVMSEKGHNPTLRPRLIKSIEAATAAGKELGLSQNFDILGRNILGRDRGHRQFC